MKVNDWATVRIATIKKECHRYDEEWRMILNGTMSGPVCLEWIPDAVVLGLNMNQGDKNHVTELAKYAGINRIYQCVIDDDGKLRMAIV